MKLRPLFSLLLPILGFGSALANPWSEVLAPSDGPPRVIGETSAGCLDGAAVLPAEGEGYVVMHLERRRYFGHPSLIEAIRTLGEEAAGGLGVLHVGDLSLPRGGPMPNGHRSHQSGIDADIWFDLSPTLHVHADRWRSNVPAPSLLRSASGGLDYRLWSDRQVRILKAAASLPEVDRIFVNAHIKRELCETVRGARGWLRKIRPWYYHEDHFHMRLVCPADSPLCVRQEAVPPGDGCDASLDWWLRQHPPPVPRPSEPRPLLPAACRELLARR
ncbi:penicillin-insensitive murein endopeptidase [Candidatus Methylocalor cossyra]|uniref:Penicillin-insensitive murein endopeptidase n=1 Tax=Candidatus Methylocalor cossyra TaxID=3108543 RepID=A0ABM9NHC8_9GAMM